ncbi:LysE family transporter [Capillibacterium thermochitinicola]|uniref:LysE family transporter n=1 Tax=Capillibacterium thermochitinicola TaxID=2699427 RepID=A0A8J6LMT4_9FIRM|nr:LysE family transporter [Capillibacterium thermochitinicola]MBA2133173.1 LysE family transporter [Capillibacterium thermochitinicola]
MIAIFVQSILIGYSGAVMPGSLLTYTLDQSLKSGVKAGFMVSLGHSLLELFLVIAIFLGFGQYLTTTLAQILIGLGGGLLLIFLGGRMVQDSWRGNTAIILPAAAAPNNRSMLLGGALISAANPYFIIWWVVVGPGLIMNAFNAFGFGGVLLFYLGHILADFSWYLLVSWLVGKTRTFINPLVYRLVIGGLGLCLIGFGAGFFANSLPLIF